MREAAVIIVEEGTGLAASYGPLQPPVQTSCGLHLYIVFICKMGESSYFRGYKGTEMKMYTGHFLMWAVESAWCVCFHHYGANWNGGSPRSSPLVCINMI